jgi:hypothetical protein
MSSELVRMQREPVTVYVKVLPQQLHAEIDWHFHFSE